MPAQTLERQPASPLFHAAVETAGAYCNGILPGPGKPVIGVPSVPLPELTLFFNDWTAPLPVLLTR